MDEQKLQRVEISAPIMALDLGQKRIGVAISDSLSLSVRRLEPLVRSNWKRLVEELSLLTRRFDARTLVIGLPLSLDGTKGEAAHDAERVARNFARSLRIPVYLQDERLTSAQAETNLRDEGYALRDFPSIVDSESAAIILRDFIVSRDEDRIEVVVQPDS